jgi:Flp pilus assembly protein TadG
VTRLGRAGAVGFEFALISGAFFVFLLGAMDIGRYFMTEHALHTLASVTARAALIDSTQHGCANVCVSPLSSVLTTLSSAVTTFINTSNLTLNVSQATTSGVTTITVTAAYPYTFFAPYLSTAFSGPLSDTIRVSY